MNKRITWCKPDGSWGIEGVDLAALPVTVYGALFKLKRYEDLGKSPDQIQIEMDDTQDEIAHLRKENESVRQNSISIDAYKMICASPVCASPMPPEKKLYDDSQWC